MTFKKKTITRVKFREYITLPNTEHRVLTVKVKGDMDVTKTQNGVEITIDGKTELYPWSVVQQVRSVAEVEPEGEPDAET